MKVVFSVMETQKSKPKSIVVKTYLHRLMVIEKNSS